LHHSFLPPEPAPRWHRGHKEQIHQQRAYLAFGDEIGSKIDPLFGVLQCRQQNPNWRRIVAQGSRFTAPVALQFWPRERAETIPVCPSGSLRTLKTAALHCENRASAAWLRPDDASPVTDSQKFAEDGFASRAPD
jgi:hypothetical protein